MGNLESAVTDLDDRLQHGETLQRSGRLDEALSWYQRIVDEQPANRRAKYLLGEVRVSVGDIDAARSCFEELLRDSLEQPPPSNNGSNVVCLTFPEDVDGWLSRSEGHVLAELARGRRVLEVGSWCGRSTICLAQTARAVHAVDWFRGDCHAGHRDTLLEFLANLERYQVRDRVIIHHGLLEDVAPVLGAKSFDMVFLDSAHDESSIRDANFLTEPLLAAGGIWVFHDFANPDYPAVKATVAAFARRRNLAVQIVDSLGILRSRRSSPNITLSVIVPTIGRSSLAETLHSIAQQRLLVGDEVLVVGDGNQPDAQRMFHESGLLGAYVSVPGPSGNWGHTPRNLVMPRARGDYLLFIDDDDEFMAGAFSAVRRALTENPGRPHVFRMIRPLHHDILWSTPELRHANVSTQMIAVPNLPSRLGTWGTGYDGDFEFIASTAARSAGSLVWRPEVIAVWGRSEPSYGRQP